MASAFQMSKYPHSHVHGVDRIRFQIFIPFIFLVFAFFIEEIRWSTYKVCAWVQVLRVLVSYLCIKACSTAQLTGDIYGTSCLIIILPFLISTLIRSH